MKSNIPAQTFMMVYQALWKTLLPLLKTNARLRQGFSRRTRTDHLKSADIWIQAASAGESYLAVQLLKELAPEAPVKILLTTTTSQGLDILRQGIRNVSIHPHLKVAITWFPFDLPELAVDTLKRIRPTIMVLLETEIWPGLFYALKQQGTTVFIINARLSKKSLGRYLTMTWLLKTLSPNKILAITPEDAERFRRIFSSASIEVMPNIKFDVISQTIKNPNSRNSLTRLISSQTPLAILASVRKAEEADAAKIINALLKKNPNQVVALFPRHMHRMDAWKKRLTRMGVAWQLRSETATLVKPGGLILWDTFGELKQAYHLAVTAFIGGSLKPLGGQNFIEPVTCGVATVTGPFVDDFTWAGDGIFKEKLAAKADDWKGVARFMIRQLESPPDKAQLRERAERHIQTRRGGSAMACRLITRFLGTDCGKSNTEAAPIKPLP